MIQNHTFVGMADATLALIQHGTRLYLVDTTAITKEMLYQQVSFPGKPCGTFIVLFPLPIAGHQSVVRAFNVLRWMQVLSRFEQVMKIEVDGVISIKQLTLLALEMETEDGERVLLLPNNSNIIKEQVTLRLLSGV